MSTQSSVDHRDLPISGIVGELKINEPMAPHTSWKVGGAADYYYIPKSKGELSHFLCQLPEEVRLYWVGLGTNLLVREGGLRGAVVCTHKGLSAFTWLENGNLYVEAGVPCARVARSSLACGYIGGDFFLGIPGTFGGALAMNAGAYGGETWGVVSSVETIDRHGDIHRRDPSDYEIGYRSIHGPEGEWFVSAELQFGRGDSVAARERAREIAKARSVSQPVQAATAGSVFRNPEGGYAAQLIESAGLKGARIGGAVVSSLHANFIVNEGQASAGDIEQLIELVSESVEKYHGVVLIPEVKIVGEELQ